MAAPHVTGAVALVKSRYPWENYFGIRDRILMGVDHLASLSSLWRTGGRLNLYNALQPRNLMLNLSTRARVEGGDSVMIAGFVVGGSRDGGGAYNGGPIRLAFRGLGPSVPVNVPRLGDPVITIYNSAGIAVASNDNWAQDPSAPELVADGLAPTNVHEAALIASLNPGAYTVVLADKGTQYGVGIVEIYNLDGSSNERSRLLNLSTRCLVGSGDDTAVAGLIARGPSPADSIQPADRPGVPDRRVLIRGMIPVGVSRLH
jgi:hypothetical protein